VTRSFFFISRLAPSGVPTTLNSSRCMVNYAIGCRRIWPNRARCQCGDLQDYNHLRGRFGSPGHQTRRLSGQLAREISLFLPHSIVQHQFYSLGNGLYEARFYGYCPPQPLINLYRPPGFRMVDPSLLSDQEQIYVDNLVFIMAMLSAADFAPLQALQYSMLLLKQDFFLVMIEQVD